MSTETRLPASSAASSTSSTTSSTTLSTSSAPREHLLVRWFVRFNPLFTLSALCVLVGVLAWSQWWRSNDQSVGTSLVLEAYQWVLIGTAALLYRRLNEHRPGVILGLIAVVFLVDPTLQLSALATYDHVVVCVLWVVLVVVKLRALQWAFCLSLSLAAQVLPALLAAFVALLPNARRFDDIAANVPDVVAIGIFALGALATLLPLSATSTRALGAVGTQMFPRVIRAAVAIGVAGVLYQAANAIYGGGAATVFGACLLVTAIRLPRTAELAVWLCVYVGWVCCATPTAFALAAASLMLASRQHAPRMLVAGIVLASSSSLDALVEGVTMANRGHLVVVTLMTVALLVVLVRRRAPSAALVLCGVFGAPLYAQRDALDLLPSNTLGVLLVGVGFALVPLGLIAHRRLSRMVAADDERLAQRSVAERDVASVDSFVVDTP